MNKKERKAWMIRVYNRVKTNGKLLNEVNGFSYYFEEKSLTYYVLSNTDNTYIQEIDKNDIP